MAQADGTGYQGHLDKLADDAINAHGSLARVIPCYLVYVPGNGTPFYACSKTARDPEDAKAWLKAKLRYEYVTAPKRFQGPPVVAVQEDWGKILTWFKVNVLPNTNGIVYED